MSTENTVDTRPDPVAGSQCDHYAEESSYIIAIIDFEAGESLTTHEDISSQRTFIAPACYSVMSGVP